MYVQTLWWKADVILGSHTLIVHAHAQEENHMEKTFFDNYIHIYAGTLCQENYW